MAAQFPTNVPVYSNPTASMTLGSADHVALHSNINDDVIAIATKLGKGASVPNTAGALRVTNAGTQSTGFGLITYAELATVAATQTAGALGSSGQITTTSTTAVDMTDMSVPLTTIGGNLLCWFSGICFTNTAAGSINFWFKLDAAADSFAHSINLPSANIATNVSFIAVFSGVSAAAHTVKLRWAVGAGQTGTMFGNQRYCTVVEFRR